MAEAHAENLWELLGPPSLSVFPETIPVLQRLKGAGIPLAVVSNWQCGLGHFCTELGIAEAVDHVIVSAEIGSSKPDVGIFQEACRRLQTPSHRILHVGDNPRDDLEGGRAAGLQVVLVQRETPPAELSEPTISSLDGLTELLGL